METNYQKYLEMALNNFGKAVVEQSRLNLKRLNKNASGKLDKSISYEVDIHKNSFTMSFNMEKYGVFQDVGVSGIKKKYNTPYSYKTKMPPPNKLDKWTVIRGIAARDENGRFLPRKTVNFLIAKSIFINGIKPSLFFTNAFGSKFKIIPDKIVEDFGLDIESFLKNIINNNGS